MSFGRLVLVAAILKTPNGMPHLPCEDEQINKFNLGFVSGFDDHPNDPNMSVYCGVFQRYADDLSSSAQCKGRFIDSIRFQILQHLTMDKTLELCPHHNLEALKNVVQADKKYRLHIENLLGVGKDDFAPCAANIHVKCATQMQQKMGNGVGMCSTLQDFTTCYENPEEPCSAEIYKDFVNLSKKIVSQIFEMYKESPGLLPGC